MSHPVRITVQSGPLGEWTEPDPVAGVVAVLEALASPAALGMITPEGKAQIRAALTAADEALSSYPGGHRLIPDDGVLLTAEQLAAWAGLGRPLSPAELDEVDDAIPDSAIPGEIEQIVTGLGLTRESGPS